MHKPYILASLRAYRGCIIHWEFWNLGHVLCACWALDHRVSSNIVPLGFYITTNVVAVYSTTKDARIWYTSYHMRCQVLKKTTNKNKLCQSKLPCLKKEKHKFKIKKVVSSFSPHCSRMLCKYIVSPSFYTMKTTLFISKNLKINKLTLSCSLNQIC